VHNAFSSIDGLIIAFHGIIRPHRRQCNLWSWACASHHHYVICRLDIDIEVISCYGFWKWEHKLSPVSTCMHVYYLFYSIYWLRFQILNICLKTILTWSKCAIRAKNSLSGLLPRSSTMGIIPYLFMVLRYPVQWSLVLSSRMPSLCFYIACLIGSICLKMPPGHGRWNRLVTIMLGRAPGRELPGLCTFQYFITSCLAAKTRILPIIYSKIAHSHYIRSLNH